MIENIYWFGHASFRINSRSVASDPVIYIDPWRLPADAEPADVILISHDHHDHCSLDDIARIRQPDTVVICNHEAASIIPAPVNILKPWQGAVNVGAVSIRAVPAYTPEHAYHAEAFGGLGFLISLRRYDVYFAGDTGVIPEMEKVGCDVALLPVGGWYTMDYLQAAQVAEMIHPRIAIPMHYGIEVPGSDEQGKRFCEALRHTDIEAVELTPDSTILET